MTKNIPVEFLAVTPKVSLFRNDCYRSAPAGGKGVGTVTCTKRLISKGHVTGVLNEHYSEAIFSDGVEMHEGDVVDKTK